MQPRERLVYELEAAASAEPPETFCGRYILLAEQAGGTQGVINFARSAHGGVEQYAIKFFVKGLPEYEEEVGLYERAELRNLLPELLMHSDNADGSQCSRSGYPWPPFMVVERGVTLTDWLTNAKMHRSYPEILHMFQQVSALLDGLHKAGFVHRDIKPENTLYLINSSGAACPLRMPNTSAMSWNCYSTLAPIPCAGCDKHARYPRRFNVLHGQFAHSLVRHQPVPG
jgi:hypothetical protein